MKLVLEKPSSILLFFLLLTILQAVSARYEYSNEYLNPIQNQRAVVLPRNVYGPNV